MSHESIQTMISLDAITPSPTNPRKDFPPDMLAALAENILLHGVLQPVLVRFDKADATRYELVCGERRYRAARTAGLKQIPAMVRELTDEQVIEVQLVENLQREGLSPIEEAEGYERLQKECGLTADQIAEKIGQSRSYVFGRLKLLDLGEVARKALREGKLTPSTALLIARIPIKSMQEQATREITENNWLKDVLSYREAAKHVQSKYMLRLSTARFDTQCETLIATAGSCHKCPNRTGNQPALFDDVDSADVCTNPECFSAKNVATAAKKAAAEAAERQAREERERLVRDEVEEAEFKQQLENENRDAYLDAINAGKPSQEQAPATATIEQHVKAKGIDTKTANDAVKHHVENTYRQRIEYSKRLFARCRSHLIQHTPEVPDSLRPLLAFVAIMFYERWGDADIAELWLGPIPESNDISANRALIAELGTRIPSFNGYEVVRLLCDIAVIDDALYPAGDRSLVPVESLAALCGIDKEAFRAEIAAEEKAKREAEEAKAAVEAAAKGKKTAPKQGKKPAAKTASHPSPAPRGGEVKVAKKSKAAPAAKPKAAPKKSAPKGKDQAPAKPAAKPTPSAGTKTPAPKYRNPANADQTWSGVGKKPAWVAEALASGTTLAELEAGSHQAPAKPAKDGKTITVPPLSPKAAWPFPASAEA